MKKILIIEPLLEEVITFFKENWLQHSYSIDYESNLAENQISKKLSEGKYDAIIVRNKLITREIIQTWAEAKKEAKLCIVRAGSNTSTIDIKSADEYGITVMNTPGANSAAVAQYIITQFILLSRCAEKSLKGNDDIKNKVTLDKHLYTSHTLTNDTLALIGTGFIGSKVSKIANSLGMRVKAYSPHLTKERAESINAIYCTSLEEAIQDADFVSIQVPFTKQGEFMTLGMINSEILNLLKDGAKLINVSRRDVVNMKDLETALNNGKLSAVSLDLLRSEIEEIRVLYPSIIDNQNNIITPLIACESYKADKQITTEALLKIEQFLKEAY